MKRISKLLVMLLTLCLLFSLSGTPALAESAYKEEFASTGGWPPEIIGSWAGYWMGSWGMFTFYPNGRYDLTVFDFPGNNSTGTSKTLEPADESYVEGDILHLSDHGSSGELRRISMPYVRLKAEEETVEAGMDPALMGTFGGKVNGVYVEWTFHGDGRLTQVTPTQELRENGTYFTGGEELAILLNGKISKYPYKIASLFLFIYWSQDNRYTLSKRAGPLVQVPLQWHIDEPVPEETQK